MILMFDGFDNIAATDFAMKGWNSAFNAMVGGRFGFGQACTTTTLKYKTFVDNTGAVQNSGSTVFLQCGYQAAAGAGTVVVLQALDGGTPQFTLAFVHGADVFKLYRGDINGTLIQTSPQVTLTTGTWYLIELMVVIGTSAGAATLRFGNVQLFAATSLNTQNSAHAYVNQAGFGGGPSADLWDDFIVFDSVGAVPNAFIGDKRIGTRYPVGDGAHSDFVPLGTSLNHWSNVDETTPNATDGAISSTAGAIDTYVIDDLPAGATVLAVQISLAVVKTDSGVRQCTYVVRQAGTDYAGPNRDVPATPGFVQFLLPQNPATSAPWTLADFNADEMGIKVVA